MDDISQYYEQHAQTVLRYLYRLCGDEGLAEELCQETFFQAIRTVDRYRGDCKPSVWLCQIARHCWYKHLEKNKRLVPYGDIPEGNIPEGNIPDGKLPDAGGSPDIAGNNAAAAGIEERLSDREDMMAIYSRMQKLRGEVREVMYLRILGELSFTEIGTIMGRTENWARVTFFRGKNEIREDMSK